MVPGHEFVLPAEASSQVWRLGSPGVRAEGLRSSSTKAGLVAGNLRQVASVELGAVGVGGEEVGVRAGEEVASDRKAKWARAGWREAG